VDIGPPVERERRLYGDRHAGRSLHILVVVNVLSQDELDRKLAEAQRRLREAFGPCSIYLFGSYASGAPKAGSDIDLAVVLPSSSVDFHTRCVQACRVLAGFGHPTDVLVYTVEEFDERAGWFASLERTVKETGRLLHAA